MSDFRGAGGQRALRRTESGLNKNVFSLRLKVGIEQESTMSAVSEFQTAGAEQRKARSAKLVLQSNQFCW